MNKLIKICFVFFAIVLGGKQSYAQSNIEHSIQLGFPSYLFDSPERGIYAGYLLSLPVRNRFSIDVQISYAIGDFDRSSDNFAHDGGILGAFNLLGGGRLYLLKETKSIRPYVNLLLGYGYVTDHEYNANNEFIKNNFHSVGYSAGAYISILEKANLGISFENYSSFVLKAGYIF